MNDEISILAVEILEKRIYVRALVDSASVKGAKYVVEGDEDGWTCTCPDATERNSTCKHIRAVRSRQNI